MWRPKKLEELTSAGSNSDAQSPLVRDLRPMPASLRPADSQARIGKSLTFQGDLKGAEDLYLDGEFQGTIELNDHNLVVGPQGRVRADIQAREIVIEGNVQGNLRARDRLQIRKTGSVVGDLVAARIVIEDGAYFKGSIDIERAAERSGRGEVVSADSFASTPTLAAEPKE